MEHGVAQLIGKTITKIDGDVNSDVLRFHTADEKTYIMLHDQHCCEHVYLENVAGDMDWLIGSPITMAYEESNRADEKLPESDDSATWTFFRLGTKKGTVVFRWYGSSNGYYSETADFYEEGKRYS